MSSRNEEQTFLNAFDREIMKGLISETIQIYFQGVNFTSEELEQILNVLSDENPTIESLKKRSHDDTIIIMANEMNRKKSCIGNKTAPLSVKKKKLTPKQFLKYMAVILAALQLMYGVAKYSNNEKIKDEALSSLSSSGYSVENIVEYNQERIIDNSGDIYYEYDAEGIANTILKESQGNDVAMGVAIREAFDTIDDNEWGSLEAMEEMDKIIAEFGFSDYSTFLGYLIESGNVTPDNKYYDKIIEINKKLSTGGTINILDINEKAILRSVRKDYGKSITPYTAVLGETEENPIRGGR